MKIKLFFIITLAIILQLSCKKYDLRQEKKTNIRTKIIESAILSAARNGGTIEWEKVYNEINKNVAGIFGFSTYRTHFSEYTSGRFQGFYKPSLITAGLDVKVNDRSSSSDLYNNYLLFDDRFILPLFEHSVNLQIGYQINNDSYLFNKIIELPKKLEILPDDNLNTVNGVVNNGTSISWTEDESNTDTHIIISIRFDPSNINNVEIKGYSEPIIKTLLVADNGSYTINSEDIEIFPNNVFVDINIYRGQISIYTHEDSQKEFALGSYSCVMMNARINK